MSEQLEKLKEERKFEPLLVWCKAMEDSLANLNKRLLVLEETKGTTS